MELCEYFAPSAGKFFPAVLPKISLYYYYHCISPCKFRYRADKLNTIFENELKKYVPHPSVQDLYKIILNDLYKKKSKQVENGSKHIAEQIEKVNQRLSKARELLLSDDLDPKEYKEIKSECENMVNRLEAELTEANGKPNNSRTVSKMLDAASLVLSRLDILYQEGDIRTKREIISSIFPEKICFDGNECRTFRVNEAARFMFMIIASYRIKKTGKEVICHSFPVL